MEEHAFDHGAGQSSQWEVSANEAWSQIEAKIRHVEKETYYMTKVEENLEETLDELFPFMRQTPEMRDAHQKGMEIHLKMIIVRLQNIMKDLIEEKNQFDLLNPLGPKSASKIS